MFCKNCVISKKTSHWEGGKGVRNALRMNKKDNKKYVGLGKVRSNKDKRKTADRKRGNKTKKDDE